MALKLPPREMCLRPCGLVGEIMATKANQQQKEVEKDLAATYNRFKEFEGQRYTGMKIGRGHKWYYDKGEWKEKKIKPDEWEFTYAVVKRRAGHAPEGSGVPVGTEYHWYILAHQTVRKLNANDYTTSMTGAKFKLAHKRADKETWSASDRAQRRRLIKILQEVTQNLEQQEAGNTQTKKPLPRKVPYESDGQALKATNLKTTRKKAKPKTRRLAKVG
jgi:hypothetical protein